MKFSIDFEFIFSSWALPIAFSFSRNSYQVSDITYLSLDILILCISIETSVSYNTGYFNGFWNLAKLVFSVLLFIVGFIVAVLPLNNIALYAVIITKIAAVISLLSAVSLFKSYPYEEK